MAFSPRFLDDLRSRVSLVAIISRRVRLTRRGHEHTGLCPFHNEKSPSFTVNEGKGFFHCFGCGAHGDVISFEMHVQGLGFREAVEKLAGEAGMELPRESPAEQEKARRAATLYDVMEAACVFYERQLRGGGGRGALDYLTARGLRDETLRGFRLGYSPESKTLLKQALAAQGIEEALMVEAGLLVTPERGDSYDRFRGRVMFPITDRRGRVIAFGGRILGDGQPKYLNSPETPLFHKGAVLYGLAQAREASAKLGRVAVVEGYMDVIAMNQAGFTYAVAPLGTALTEGQIEELWRLAPEPILCFDGDGPGQRAAAKAADRAVPLLKPGHSLRFATIPAPEDPDSLIKTKGAAALQAVLDQAEPLAEALWRHTVAGRPLDTPERRAALEQDIDTLVGRIAERGVQAQYKQMFRDKLWQAFRPPRQPPRPQAKRDWQPNRGGQRGGWGVPQRPALNLPALAPVDPDRVREAILLATVLNHPELLDEVSERLGGVRFADMALDNLRQEALKHLGGRAGLDSGEWQGHLRSCGCAQALDAVLGSHIYSHASFSRAEAPVEAARDGWDHTFHLYLKKDLHADIHQAEEGLAKDMSDESYLRLRALQTEGAG